MCVQSWPGDAFASCTRLFSQAWTKYVHSQGVNRARIPCYRHNPHRGRHTDGVEKRERGREGRPVTSNSRTQSHTDASISFAGCCIPLASSHPLPPFSILTTELWRKPFCERFSIYLRSLNFLRKNRKPRSAPNSGCNPPLRNIPCSSSSSSPHPLSVIHFCVKVSTRRWIRAENAAGFSNQVRASVSLYR